MEVAESSACEAMPTASSNVPTQGPIFPKSSQNFCDDDNDTVIGGPTTNTTVPETSDALRPTINTTETPEDRHQQHTDNGPRRSSDDLDTILDVRWRHNYGIRRRCGQPALAVRTPEYGFLGPHNQERHGFGNQLRDPERTIRQTDMGSSAEIMCSYNRNVMSVKSLHLQSNTNGFDRDFSQSTSDEIWGLIRDPTTAMMHNLDCFCSPCAFGLQQPFPTSYIVRDITVPTPNVGSSQTVTLPTNSLAANQSAIPSGAPARTAPSRTRRRQLPPLSDLPNSISRNPQTAVSNQLRIQENAVPRALDPFADPDPIPSLKGWYLYPHSEPKIGIHYHTRFKVVLRYINVAVTQHPKLGKYASSLVYRMKLCGQNPESASVCIVINCQYKIYQQLRDFLNRWVNRRHWKPSSNSPGLWNTLKELIIMKTTPSAAAESPDFDIVYWRTHEDPFRRVSTVDPVQTIVHSPLTLVSSPIRLGPIRATIALVIQVGSKQYGLTVDHLLGRAEDEDGPSSETGSAPSAAYDSNTSVLSSTCLDSLTPGAINNFVRFAMGLLASFLIRILHGLTGSLLPDQPWDDGVKYLPLPDADSDIPQAPQPRSSGEDISSERNWLELGTTVFSSRTEEAKLRDAPYLDWLLIEISEKNLQRPNILNTDTVDGLPTVFQEVFSGSTQGDVPVLMLSGVMGPRQAVLLSGTAYFGGLHHRKPTLSWCIKLLDSQGIRAGESGSLIINPETQQIYGHIVAAGAHGYGYITPMFETLKQIQQSLGTRSEVVSIPDPILQLAQLEVYYEGINDKENAELAVRTLQRSLIENPLQNSQSLLGATRRKDEKAVEILLATGAKVDVVDPNTKSTALHIASMNGNLGITRMLLDEGANVRARNCNGDTPMIVARMHGNTHIIHMLVEAGAPDDSRRHDDPRLNLAAKGSLFGDSWQMNAMPNHMPQAPPPATSAESFYKSQLQANVDSYTPTFSGSETLGLKGY